MEDAAGRADSEVWGRYAAAQHIDCWCRVRGRRYGSFGPPYAAGMPGDWGIGRHGPPCYDGCPKQHASPDTIELWKKELENGDFIMDIVNRDWTQARGFEFAKRSYFCSDQCPGPTCHRPTFLHELRDPSEKAHGCPMQ